MQKQGIVILDFGSQTTQLIAKRIRSLNVPAVIIPYQTNINEILKHEPKGIILSGGPMSITTLGSPKASPDIFELNIPILGICYGVQLISHHFGGKIEKAEKKEYGETPIRLNNLMFNKDLPLSRLFHNIPPGYVHNEFESTINVWMSHWDQITQLPDEFKTIARSENCSHVAIQKDNIYGVQFHPEVTHTQFGTTILDNFISICNCKKDWTPKNLVQEIIEDIKTKTKNKSVLHAISGGVDSTVLAVLLQKAIGDRAKFIFVDTGLLELNEPKEVLTNFKQLDLNVKKIDAQEEFICKLKGIIDPEEKRKIIGDTFFEIFEKIIEPNEMLSQGTLYPDMIESISCNGPSDKIKSHHNLTEKRNNFDLLEPFMFYFKDDVRAIGSELGIPKELILRHPSPGPASAVRIIGEVTQKKLKMRKKAHQIFIEELKNENLYDQISQAYAAITSDKAVGVMGDGRKFGPMILLRAVVTEDFMTADCFEIPPKVMRKIVNRITQEVSGITRVLYDYTQKPPGTIEFL